METLAYLHLCELESDRLAKLTCENFDFVQPAMGFMALATAGTAMLIDVSPAQAASCFPEACNSGIHSIGHLGSLGVGSVGGEVEALQMHLNSLGYAIEVDGRFGHNTQAAVIAYQSSAGLHPDGIVGAATCERLCGNWGSTWGQNDWNEYPRGSGSSGYVNYDGIPAIVSRGRNVSPGPSRGNPVIGTLGRRVPSSSVASQGSQGGQQRPGRRHGGR